METGTGKAGLWSLLVMERFLVGQERQACAQEPAFLATVIRGMLDVSVA